MSEAPTRSGYDKTLDCVHCGLCLPACPTYDELGLETDSPRGRIYLMRALAEGRIRDPEGIRPFLDRCLDCRACETACPSGVAYGRILEETRAVLSARKNKPAERFRAWLLERVVAHPGRLRAVFSALGALQASGLLALARAWRCMPAGARLLAPRIPPRRARRPLRGRFAPEGRPRGTVALFTGCVNEQLFGDVNRRTVALLVANGFAVEVPGGQRCCGALLAHAGRLDAACELARANVEAFAGAEVVIHNAAGCGAAMREYGEWLGTEAAHDLARRSRDVCALLGERGLMAEPAPRPARVAYDDPCHLCHGQGVRAEPRELLRRVPGLELVPHAEPERCCGSAGIYNLLQPELGAAIGERKARALLESGAEIVATGNPGCILQIRAHLRRLGGAAQVMHPVELLLPAGAPIEEVSR